MPVNKRRRKRNRTPVHKMTRMITPEPVIKQEACYSGAPAAPQNSNVNAPPMLADDDAMGLPDLPDMKDINVKHDPALHEDVKRSWEAALAIEQMNPLVNTSVDPR